MRNFILLPFLSILPLLVQSETSQHNKFSECKITAYSCGADSICNISYPFRVPSMPEYCGLPGYDITCKYNNTDNAMLVLEVGSKEYKVGNISYENRTINLINTDFRGDTCPHAFHNTTFNFSRFSYAEYDLNLTVYFHCSPFESWPSNHPNLRKVPCQQGSNLNYNPYYSLPDDYPQLSAELWTICNSTVLIPFLGEYWKQLEEGGKEFWDIMKYGFDLNWTSDGTEWCKVCEDTGGFCVCNLKSPGQPNCACNGTLTSGTCRSNDACDDGSITNGTCGSNGMLSSV